MQHVAQRLGARCRRTRPRPCGSPRPPARSSTPPRSSRSPPGSGDVGGRRGSDREWPDPRGPGPPGRFAFVHALARDAVYATMTATRRARLHQLIAEAMEAGAPAAPAVLAHHYLQAAPLAGPDKAVQWAIAAAEAAERALAFEEVVDHYQNALELLDRFESSDDAVRCRILIAHRLQAGHLRRRPPRGLRASRSRSPSAMAGPKSSPRPPSRARPGPRMAGSTNACSRCSSARLAALPATDGAQRAQLLGALAGILAIDGRDPGRRETLSREAIAMARRLGDPTVLARALRSRSAALPGPTGSASGSRGRRADRAPAPDRTADDALGACAPQRAANGARRHRGARHDVEALAADVARDQGRRTTRARSIGSAEYSPSSTATCRRPSGSRGRPMRCPSGSCDDDGHRAPARAPAADPAGAGSRRRAARRTSDTPHRRAAIRRVARGGGARADRGGRRADARTRAARSDRRRLRRDPAPRRLGAGAHVARRHCRGSRGRAGGRDPGAAA